MIVAVPDHHTANIGGALVERAARVIDEQQIVPAYLHQYAEAWDKGLRYGGKDESFWQAVGNHNKKTQRVLRREGLLRPEEAHHVNHPRSGT